MKILIENYLQGLIERERHAWQSFKSRPHTEKALADEYAAFLDRIARIAAFQGYVHDKELKVLVET